MKQGLALVLSALLVLTSCAEQGEKNSAEKSIYEQGIEVIALMNDMVSSENYVGLMFNNSETTALVMSFANEGYAEPKAVYKVCLSGDALLELLTLSDISQLPDRLGEHLRSRALGTVPGLVNAKAGIDMLASVSACAAEKTFVSSEISEDVAYLYTYENAAPVFVTFTVGEGGAVSALGQFIFDEAAFMDAAEEYGMFSLEDITDEVKK